MSDGEGIYKVVQAFAILGEKETALKLFEKAVDTGFYCYPYFQNDPLIDNLRNESKFAEILMKTKNNHENFKN